jgi:hypothetical protein
VVAFYLGWVLMKSCLLSAESSLSISHEEGNDIVYIIRLIFIDLLGRQRSHFATVSIPREIAFSDRISFTALSNIEIYPGVIEDITDSKLLVATLVGKIDLPNIHNHSFSIGQAVIVVEHTDISGDNELMNIAIPYPLTMEPDMLRLQSVNADIIASDGSLLFRLSADPLYQGSSIHE